MILWSEIQTIFPISKSVIVTIVLLTSDYKEGTSDYKEGIHSDDFQA